MHILEGVLSAPVLLTGAAITMAGCSVGLKKMDYDRVPQVAILSSTFLWHPLSMSPSDHQVYISY